MLIALCVYYLLTFSTDTDLFAFLEDLVSQPDPFFTLAAKIGNIGDIDGPFLFHDPALALGIGPLVPFHKIELFHNDPFFVPHDPDYLAGLPFFPAGGNLYHVSLFQMLSLHCLDPCFDVPLPV